MSEAHLPVPDPEPEGSWNPQPARCHCGEIIDAHPASRKDEQWEGWCQFHGNVVAVYPNSFQETEMADEREEA